MCLKAVPGDADSPGVTDNDPRRRIADLFEIAALERPLSGIERFEAGIDEEPGELTVRSLYETAFFERPLLECERRALRRDGARSRR